jgi:hypothetical protein
MGRLRQLSLLLPILLAGCADASLKYRQWDGQAPIQSTSVKFVLQGSAVTLQAPQANNQAPQASGHTSPANQTSGGQVGRSAQGQFSCDKDSWWSCFKGMSAQSAPTAPALTETSPQPWEATWIASSDSKNLLATTAISGTVISGQDALYSVVTIKVTSKTASVVTAAGTGAATGFGIGGPYGAVLGGALGVGSALLGSGSGTATTAGSTQSATPYALAPYICSGEYVGLSNMATNPAPEIQFPIVLKPTPEQLAPASENTKLSSPKDVPAACWRMLPNTIALAIPTALATSDNTNRPASSGDGWLFRFVASDDVTQAPKGTESAADFFTGKDSQSAQEFPYSSCRKTTLQVVWWNELNDAIAHGGAPRVLKYTLNVADPRFVNTAQVKKGGVINFKSDCGANVSITPDTSTGPILNAVVTQGEAVYKAEQTWAGGSKK